MVAFHHGAPAVARRPWLAALPVGSVLWTALLVVPQVTGNSAWVPDFPGLCCVFVSLACLAHVPAARFRPSPGSAIWSLTLMPLAAVATAFRIVSLCDYLQDPHLISVGVVELLVLLAAVALVAPDAARARTGTPEPPPHLRAMAA